ncbi:ECF transporter S component [Ammoniphilus sp. YIM 78166]|uniref:ECF transporter S component n=1 Tax=Ammoniphilus sp. YIM 78166 TaxID=1644106 RepID=UPI001431F2B4|nr:ECF transporter S component [Ammoniphilus sp. YIM 78166]
METRKITLCALLIALSVVGRMTFTFIPNVQPVTVLIIITSFVLGPLYGVIVACLSTWITNLLLGMGLWTIWQMLSWSIVAGLSGWLGKIRRKVPVLVLSLYAGFCGLLYGLLISYPMSQFIGNFWLYYLSGLPFDLNHALGNILFFLVLYPAFTRLAESSVINLRPFQRKP